MMSESSMFLLLDAPPSFMPCSQRTTGCLYTQERETGTQSERERIIPAMRSGGRSLRLCCAIGCRRRKQRFRSASHPAVRCANGGDTREVQPRKRAPVSQARKRQLSFPLLSFKTSKPRATNATPTNTTTTPCNQHNSIPLLMQIYHFTDTLFLASLLQPPPPLRLTVPRIYVPALRHACPPPAWTSATPQRAPTGSPWTPRTRRPRRRRSLAPPSREPCSPRTPCTWKSRSCPYRRRPCP